MNNMYKTSITILYQPTEAEIRARLAVQIAFTCDRLQLDLLDLNACVTLGIRYWENGASPATAYEQAIKTAHNVTQMNKLIQAYARCHHEQTTHH